MEMADIVIFTKTGPRRSWTTLNEYVYVFQWARWARVTIKSPVAQWLEHPTRSRRVVGSNPIWDSDFFRVLQTFTALFNNTRTLKFKAQPTNAFFAAVNQVFGGSSQLTTTAELCSLSELCTTIWSPRARQQSKAGRSRRTFDWR